MEAIFVSKPYRYARKFLLSSKVILYTSVSKPYRYARKETAQIFGKEMGRFQNLIGMLGSDTIRHLRTLEKRVSKPYRYARKTKN